jgi:hypothetical protein
MASNRPRSSGYYTTEAYEAERQFEVIPEAEAGRYRLIDPDDTSEH